MSSCSLKNFLLSYLRILLLLEELIVTFLFFLLSEELIIVLAEEFYVFTIWQIENTFFSSTVQCNFQLPFLLYHQVLSSVWISLLHVNIERLFLFLCRVKVHSTFVCPMYTGIPTATTRILPMECRGRVGVLPRLDLPVTYWRKRIIKAWVQFIQDSPNSRMKYFVHCRS